jgi:hypothetical protein
MTTKYIDAVMDCVACASFSSFRKTFKQDYVGKKSYANFYFCMVSTSISIFNILSLKMQYVIVAYVCITTP